MFLNFVIKKVTVTGTIWILSYFLGARAGFEICLEPEPEPENQKRAGSSNAAYKPAFVHKK